MNVPILFILTIGILITIKIMMSFGNKNYKTEKDKFLDEERKANMIRKSKFNEDFTITVDTTRLPFKNNYEQNSSLCSLEEHVKKLSQNKMINLDKNYSNIELKHLFGFNQMDKVFTYEDNYNNFIISLNDWAKELICINNIHDAEIILEYAHKIGSKHTQTYKMLFDIYNQHNNIVKFQELLDNITKENYINEYERKFILKYVDELKSS